MNRLELFSIINSGFSISEIQQLCFQLGVDYENFGGGNKNQIVIELIGYFERRQELNLLERTCRILRPNSFRDFIPPAHYSTSVPVPFEDINEAISALARLSQPHAWQSLEITKPLTNGGWIGTNSDNFVSLLYAIYKPLIAYKLIQNEVERNFSLLDWRTRLQFLFLEFAMQAILHDHKIAAIEPAIPYTPRVPGWRQLREQQPQQYWWQGLSLEKFENVVDAFCSTNEKNNRQTMRFMEFKRYFQELFRDVNNVNSQSVGLAGNALYSFTPGTRPVYWRIIVIQLRLYHAIVRSRADELKRPKQLSELKQFFDPPEIVSFPFDGVSVECETFEPFTATFNASTMFLELIVTPNVFLKLNASEYINV